MINYTSNLSFLDSLNLDGFFVGWPHPPSSETLKRIFRGSYKVVVTYEEKKYNDELKKLDSKKLSCSYRSIFITVQQLLSSQPVIQITLIPPDQNNHTQMDRS